MWGFEFVVGNDDDRHFMTQLDLGDAFALLVEQEVGDSGRHLDQHLSCTFLHRLFFHQAQDGQRQ